MKTFAGVKSFDVLLTQAAASGIAVDDYLHRTKGSDWIVFGTQSGQRVDGSPFVYAGWKPEAGFATANVTFNVFSGVFFGVTDKGVSFASSGTEHEGEPWFQQLLSFFYAEDAASPATVGNDDLF